MRFRKVEIIVALVLIISIGIIGVRMFSKEPIGFIVQDGNVIPIENTDYYTINDLLITIIFSWIGGMAALYLLVEKPEDVEDTSEKSTQEKYGHIKHLLKQDEKSVYDIILQKNGEILQKDLVSECQFSIVRVSRILDRLEKKNLIEKKRFGATNKIMVKHL